MTDRPRLTLATAASGQEQTLTVLALTAMVSQLLDAWEHALGTNVATTYLQRLGHASAVLADAGERTLG